MTPEELKAVKRGDILRNNGSGETYVVITDLPVIVAVRAITVTNATEWAQVRSDRNG